MGLSNVALLLAIIFSAFSAIAGEEFGIEDGLANPTEVPSLVAADIEKTLSDRACFAESKTTVGEALEAGIIDLGTPDRFLLLKPKQPSKSGAAWGCFCGAYTCPMWIYSFERTAVRRIWSSSGNSVETIDRRDQGSKRLLLSSRSAGHQNMTLYAWNGREYTVLREKTVSGSDMSEQAERDMARFRSNASRD